MGNRCKGELEYKCILSLNAVTATFYLTFSIRAKLKIFRAKSKYLKTTVELHHAKLDGSQLKKSSGVVESKCSFAQLANNFKKYI